MRGNKDLKADVRIISATNQDLELVVRKGTFREDLFYWLNVITLRMPPSESCSDLPWTTDYY